MKQNLFSLKDILYPKHSIAKLPQKVLGLMSTKYLLAVFSAVITQLYCFVLTGATTAIENGAVILGIILFIVYQLRGTVSSIVNAFAIKISAKTDAILTVDLSEHSMKVMANTSGKVVFNEELVGNSVLLTCIAQYIYKYRETWQALISFIIRIAVFIVSIVSMLKVAVSKFENLWLFASTTIIAIAVNFVIAYKKSLHSQKFFEQNRDLFRKKESQKNTCVNMRIISKEHSDFMLNNYLNTLVQKADCEIKEGTKNSIMGIKNSVVCAIAIIVVVIDAIITTGIKGLDATAFMNIVALATVFASILDNVSYQLADWKRVVDVKCEFSKEVPLFEAIMKVHDAQKEEVELKEDELVLEPFEFSYGGGNFTLRNSRRLLFNKGEMVLLKGDSGAGKSTLLKVLCGEVDTGRNHKVRSIHYSSEGELGCESMDEITFGNVQRDRLISILKGVQIYDLLLEKAEGKDILDYLAEMRGGLSTGMQDRLMLARTLYNLDNCSLVLIDEPIGGVDIETGKKVIKFIKEFAARRYKKIVVVTTHQYPVVEKAFDKAVDVKREGCESFVV